MTPLIERLLAGSICWIWMSISVSHEILWSGLKVLDINRFLRQIEYLHRAANFANNELFNFHNFASGNGAHGAVDIELDLFADELH